MIIGFDINTGHVYGGGNAPQFAIWPSPTLSQAKLIESLADWDNLPAGPTRTPFAWVFREDMFDPVTRVRRGRLYEPYPGMQPDTCPVSAHPFDHEGVRQVAASRGLTKELFKYWPCQTFLNRNDRGLGTTLALGQGRSASAWRVVQTEVVIGDDVLVTLKALTAYGILPELRVSQLSNADRRSVEGALERVINAAFREAPISVVDHCRNAATVVLARWMASKGAEGGMLEKELGQVAKAVEGEPYRKVAAHHAAEVIRRLHPRGKSNEQETKGLRVPVEEDAELAIHALGFILREVGWAK